MPLRLANTVALHAAMKPPLKGLDTGKGRASTHTWQALIGVL